DRVIHMEEGKIVGDGDPDTVIDKYMLNRLTASEATRKVFKRSLEAQGLMPGEAAGEEATLDGVER
ncbi:MAG: hypothetical protein J4N95_08595, partial [Chloroflexi bacterium]|nr:hypothetical protein [Chloroflexota bacterium]